MAEPGLRLADLPKYLSNEADAWQLLERLRWNETPVCPHCGTASQKHYYLSTRSGERRTRTGNVSYRRLWKCQAKDCRKQFSVLVGTIFESSKIPVSKWLLAIWMMGAGKNGVAAKEMERALAVSYQSAWFMMHRIREAMKREPLAAMLSGTVVSDESFVGGKPKNRHRQGKPRPGSGRGLAGQAEVKSGRKTPILALVDAETGEVRPRVIADVTGATLRKAIAEQVDMPNTVLHTDGWKPYVAIGKEMAGHEWVDHDGWEYVRGDVSTNYAESFFSQFKRSVDGTYHSISKHHLDRYLTEFEYRWNTRKMSDAERIEIMIDRTAGRRLSYRPLIERPPKA